MTNVYVVGARQISLDGHFYNIKGPVRSFLASQYAPRIVIGAQDMQSHEDVSYLRWDNWTEGIGLNEFFSAGGEAPKRAWFSTCNLSNDKHLTLGPLVTKTAAIPGTFPTAAAGDDVPALIIFKSAVYALVRNTVATVDRMRVYKYDDAADSWGSAVMTFPAGSESFSRNVDMVQGFVNGVANLIVCAGDTYSYSTDGAAWTNSTKNVMRLAVHDDALWGIDRTGQLWKSTTLGTNVNKAILPVPSAAATTDIAYISDLFQAPDASGDPALWAATAFGLYNYDATNDKWLKSQFTFPEARYNGRGTNIWNADLYIPAGMGLWRAVFGGTTVVVPVGPDQDHGLPDVNRGAIVDLAPGHDMLAVCLEGDFTGFRHYVTTATDLRSSVLAYNGKGWQVLWKSTTASERARKLIIGSAYDKYRLYFSTTVTTTARDIYYIDIASERVDVHQAQSRTYAASSALETPWYKVGTDVEGVAVSVLVEGHDLTADETVKVDYEVNYSGTYTNIATLAGDAVGEFMLPSASDPTGLLFNAIRFQGTLVRGTTTTKRPFLHSLTLKFLKRIPERFTHILTLDLHGEIEGLSAREQWQNLRATLRKRGLLEFTFRDDPALTAEERFFVRATQMGAVIETGLDYRGEVSLQLTEVQHVVGGMWNIDNWDQFLWG